MNILVISDSFYGLIPDKSIHYLRWHDEEFPSALIGYQAILIDMTMNQKEQKSSTPLLYKLMVELEDEELLRQNNIVLIIVCGTPQKHLKYDIRDNSDYNDIQDDQVEEYYIQQFETYSFLDRIVPAYSSRMFFKKNTHSHPVAFAPAVTYYLERCEGSTNHLYYDYLPGARECIDITPLAKIAANRDACVAFECKKGKSVAVLLPTYDQNETESSFSLLLRICRSYIKKKGGMMAINKEVCDILPDSAKEAYIEALMCFNSDLYIASLMMCRRTLEASIIEESSKENGKIKTLGPRIDKLFKDGIITSEMKELAMYIKDFGDWGAHPSKYKGKKITERDVEMIIKFLERYMVYFNNYKIQVHEFEKRKYELQDMEDK